VRGFQCAVDLDRGVARRERSILRDRAGQSNAAVGAT
jgi:hypothetical protein